MIKEVLRVRDIATVCPLCGRTAEKAPHTEEHIFPLWLQHHHDLLNRRLTIPNLIDKKYNTVKIGICARCNNVTFGQLETRVSNVLTSTNAFDQSSNISRDDLATWIGKILWLLARKSHSGHDYRTRHKGHPDRILPSELLPGFIYTGMILRCFAKGKLIRACHVDKPSDQLRVMGPAYSLYIFKIDLRDDRFEHFDFVDNSAIAGVAIRSGNLGLICLFDGGLHVRFMSHRFRYIQDNALHPVQFSELTARIFYDQTLLDPSSCQVEYYWNKNHNAVYTQTTGSPGVGPYLVEMHDPERLSRMIGFYTHQEPTDILHESGGIFTTLQKLDGTFLPFAVTPEEIALANATPGSHRVAQGGDDAIRIRLATEEWAARQDDSQAD